MWPLEHSDPVAESFSYPVKKGEKWKIIAGVTLLAWFRLCHCSAPCLQPSKGSVSLIAVVLPYMNGVAVDCDAK